MGILKALVVKRFRNIPIDRQLYRRLWSDPELRELYDIEEHEKPYHPSQLTRFKQRIGPEKLETIMECILARLRDAGVIKGKIVVCDATFIQAYSKRDPKYDSKGYSDPDARVGRAYRRSYKLGWRAHTLVSMKALPITNIVRAANVNDKVLAEPLLEKASKLLMRYEKRISHYIADSQHYSEEVFKAIRRYGAEPVIPHSSKVKEPLTSLRN
jgi:hypothetical protein